MAEEKKELQSEDMENVSGGQFSLEKAKKFASKHKKALIGAGVAAAAATGGALLYKNRDALFGQEDENIDIGASSNARLGDGTPLETVLGAQKNIRSRTHINKGNHKNVKSMPRLTEPSKNEGKTVDPFAALDDDVEE